MVLNQIRISARISDLARLQAYQVGEAIQKLNPSIKIDYQFRKSLGDINLQDPLWKMPEKGVFTEDFLKDLHEGSTEMVVHSWKDLPTERHPDTEIVATLPRADQRDLLLMKKSAVGKNQIRIFSSSPRREYNLTRCLPELLPWPTDKIEFLPVRGNVQTRVRKWKEDSEIHGLIVAKAAIDRLMTVARDEFNETKNFLNSAISGENWMVLPLSLNPTAAAQGALAIEVRRDRKDLKDLLKQLNDLGTFQNVQEERRILRQYGGGCHQKIGVSVIAQKQGRILSLQGLTDTGETLAAWGLAGNGSCPQFQEYELGVLNPDLIERRSQVPRLPPGNAYWVARSEALSGNIDTDASVLWAAGIQTWKKLARRGIWIHGTSDGMGEEIPAVEHLCPRLEAGGLQWYKLTHQKSEETPRMRNLVAYELEFRSDEKSLHELIEKKMIFWRSGSQFSWVTDELKKRGLQLRAEFHGCGPGSTFDFLRKQIPEEKLFVFLSESDWRKKCQV